MSDPVIIPGIQALKDFIGKPLGPSEWLTVTQERIQAFADATDDHQWIHTDPERAARESPFGGTVAHGYLTLGLGPALLPQLFRVEPSTMTINSGIEKMRLQEPVLAGSRIRTRAEIKDVRILPSGGARTTVHVKFEVEGRKKPSCTCNCILVYV